MFIDDATERLVGLRFVPSESAFAYFERLKDDMTSRGRPHAFYSDKHSIFRVSKPAKGRVERVSRTLQDRLMKELRLEGISTIEAANAYLPAFVARFNERFATAAARPENLHRPLERAPAQLDTILACREQRYVTQQLALSYDSKRTILDAPAP